MLHTSSPVRHIVEASALVLVCTFARADKWGSPRDLAATSPSGTVAVRVRPEVGKGVSITVTRGGKDATFRGVNPEAPVVAFACDDGSVVTLNDWANVGFEHALVIYGPGGRVVADRHLEELLLPEELTTKTERSVSSRWWLADDEPARCDGARFLAPTRWGTTLAVALADGAIEGRAIPTRAARLAAHARGARPFQGVTFRVETARVEPGGDIGGVQCTIAAPRARCTTWSKTLAHASEKAVTPEALVRALRAWAQLAERRHRAPEMTLPGRQDQVLVRLDVLDGGYEYTTTWLWPLDPGFGPGREAAAVLYRLAGQPPWPP